MIIVRTPRAIMEELGSQAWWALTKEEQVRADFLHQRCQLQWELWTEACSLPTWLCVVIFPGVFGLTAIFTKTPSWSLFGMGLGIVLLIRVLGKVRQAFALKNSDKDYENYMLRLRHKYHLYGS